MALGAKEPLVLKPISDAEWKTIAGERVAEKYVISEGDTLSEISKKLFGEIRYWPKLFALNNSSVTNPHLLRPGSTLTFLPGTGSALPQLAPSDEQPPVAVQTVNHPGRSQEWQQLPRQGWETAAITPVQSQDRNGVTVVERKNTLRTSGFELSRLASSDKIKELGQIVGSRTEASAFGIEEVVYIRADEEIQIGKTYALTDNPFRLRSRKAGRVGYSYPLLGTVQILGVRDNLYVARVQSVQGMIHRGSVLIESPARVPDLKPIAASRAIDGVILIDKTESTSQSAQHKIVSINRGSDDGVKPGMIFRAYNHFDPGSEKRLTTEDFLIDGDLMVVQVSPEFSSALVLDSNSVIQENQTVLLLTNISSVGKKSIFEKEGTKSVPDTELDSLDRQDDKLGDQEKKELEQLEKHLEPGGAPPPAEAIPADATPPPAEAIPADATPPPAEAIPADAAPPPVAPQEGLPLDELLKTTTTETHPPAAELPPPTAPELPPPTAAAPPMVTPSDESKALENLMNQ